MVALAAAGLAGCTLAEAAPTVEVGATTIVLDVRTPEEFADGHLDGAVNLPVEWDGFAGAITQLDPDAEYVVYCRTGGRSALAASQMEAIALTVTDLGSIEDAERATGMAVVR